MKRVDSHFLSGIYGKILASTPVDSIIISVRLIRSRTGQPNGLGSSVYGHASQPPPRGNLGAANFNPGSLMQADRGFASTSWQRQKEGSSLGELGQPETAQAVADRRVINCGYRVAPPAEPLLLVKRGRGEGGVGEIGTASRRAKVGKIERTPKNASAGWNGE